MQDLTVIFLTVNKVPKKWAKFHRRKLEEAIGDTPIITISREPVDWGINLIQDVKPSIANIYFQLLRGAKHAKTEYIAVAEDDCLYHSSHFEYRPKKEPFAYDHYRWGLLTWGKPTYYYRPRISNSTFIGKREYVIKTLEERFQRYGMSELLREVGRERGAQITLRNRFEYFHSPYPNVFISHVNAIDPTEQTKRKSLGGVRAFDIPIWGRAEELVKKFE